MLRQSCDAESKSRSALRLAARLHKRLPETNLAARQFRPQPEFEAHLSSPEIMAFGFVLSRCGTLSIDVAQKAEGVDFYRAILVLARKFENAAGMIQHSLVVIVEQLGKTQVCTRPGFPISELAGAGESPAPS